MPSKATRGEQRSRVLREPVWERQPFESKQAWEAFAAYRDADERSYTTVAQEFDKSRRLIARWGTDWRWQERCFEYDNYVDQQARKKAIKDLAQMKRRHINLSILVQNVISEKFKGADGKSPTQLAALAEEMPLKDTARLLDVAVKIERLNRGEATEIIETPQQRRASRVDRARKSVASMIKEFPSIAPATIIGWAMEDYSVARHDLEDLENLASDNAGSSQLEKTETIN